MLFALEDQLATAAVRTALKLFLDFGKSQNASSCRNKDGNSDHQRQRHSSAFQRISQSLARTLFNLVVQSKLTLT